MRARVWAALFTLALTACAPVPQTGAGQNGAGQTGAGKPVVINGTSYPNYAAALDAMNQTYTKSVAGVEKDKAPITGRALVVVPDHDRLRPLMAQLLIAVLKRPVTGEPLEFVTEQRRLEIRAEADALVKAGEFETVTIREQNDTREPDFGDADYLVWYQVRSTLPEGQGQWSGGWRVRRAGNTAVRTAGVDQGVAPGVARYQSWVRSVHQAATDLGGASSASGAKPASAGSRAVVSSGSGIAVDGNGDVLTNAHVVATCTEPRVLDAAGEGHEATILARDATNDLAVLRVKDFRVPVTATFRDGTDLRPGDNVVVTGYPVAGLLGSEMSVTTGSLTALAGPRDDSRLLQISAPVQPGNSGGPLLDREGNVVGIIVSTFNGGMLALVTGAIPQNVNFAIKTSVAEAFLDVHHIGHAAASARPGLSPADLGERARKFTVRVECRA